MKIYQGFSQLYYIAFLLDFHYFLIFFLHSANFHFVFYNSYPKSTISFLNQRFTHCFQGLTPLLIKKWGNSKYIFFPQNKRTYRLFDKFLVSGFITPQAQSFLCRRSIRGTPNHPVRRRTRCRVRRRYPGRRRRGHKHIRKYCTDTFPLKLTSFMF